MPILQKEKETKRKREGEDGGRKRVRERNKEEKNVQTGSYRRQFLKPERKILKFRSPQLKASGGRIAKDCLFKRPLEV